MQRATSLQAIPMARQSSDPGPQGSDETAMRPRTSAYSRPVSPVRPCQQPRPPRLSQDSSAFSLPVPGSLTGRVASAQDLVVPTITVAEPDVEPQAAAQVTSEPEVGKGGYVFAPQEIKAQLRELLSSSDLELGFLKAKGLLLQWLSDPHLAEARKKTRQMLKTRKSSLEKSNTGTFEHVCFLGERADVLQKLLNLESTVRDKSKVFEVLKEELERIYPPVLPEKMTPEGLWIPEGDYATLGERLSVQEIQKKNLHELYHMLVYLSWHMEEGDIHEPALYYQPEPLTHIPALDSNGGEYFIPVSFVMTIDGKVVDVPADQQAEIFTKDFLCDHAQKQAVVFDQDKWQQQPSALQAKFADSVLHDDGCFIRDANRFPFVIYQSLGGQLPLVRVFDGQEAKAAYNKKYGKTDAGHVAIAAGQSAMTFLREKVGLNDKQRMFVRSILSQGPIDEIFLVLAETIMPKAGYKNGLTIDLSAQVDPDKLGEMELHCWGNGCLEATVQQRFNAFQVGTKKLTDRNSTIGLNVQAVTDDDGSVRISKICISCDIDARLKKKHKDEMAKMLAIPHAMPREANTGAVLREKMAARRDEIVRQIKLKPESAKELVGHELPQSLATSLDDQALKAWVDEHQQRLPALGCSEAFPRHLESSNADEGHQPSLAKPRMISTQSYDRVVTNLTKEQVGLEEITAEKRDSLEENRELIQLMRRQSQRLSIVVRSTEAVAKKRRLSAVSKQTLRSKLDLTDDASLLSILNALHAKIPTLSQGSLSQREHAVDKMCQDYGLPEKEREKLLVSYRIRFSSSAYDASSKKTKHARPRVSPMGARSLSMMTLTGGGESDSSRASAATGVSGRGMVRSVTSDEALNRRAELSSSPLPQLQEEEESTP